MSEWFATPVPRTQPPRDELAIKLALAVTAADLDLGAVIQRQRAASITAMQDLTRLKKGGAGEISWTLVLESMRFGLEAEIRWLDHCETTLARAAHQRDAAAGATTDTDTTPTRSIRTPGARR